MVTDRGPLALVSLIYNCLCSVDRFDFLAVEIKAFWGGSPIFRGKNVILRDHAFKLNPILN